MGVIGLADVFNTDGTVSLATCQRNADFEQHRSLHQLVIEAKQRADESEESKWAERREREKAEKRQMRRLDPLGLLGSANGHTRFSFTTSPQDYWTLRGTFGPR